MLHILTFPPWVLFILFFVISVLVFVVTLIWNIRRRQRVRGPLGWLVVLFLVVCLSAFTSSLISSRIFQFNISTALILLVATILVLKGLVDVFIPHRSAPSIRKILDESVLGMLCYAAHRLQELVMPRRLLFLQS